MRARRFLENRKPLVGLDDSGRRTWLQILHLGPHTDAQFSGLRMADGARLILELPGHLAEGNPENGGLVIRLFRRLVVGKGQDAEKMRVLRFFIRRRFWLAYGLLFLPGGEKRADVRAAGQQ